MRMHKKITELIAYYAIVLIPYKELVRNRSINKNLEVPCEGPMHSLVTNKEL